MRLQRSIRFQKKRKRISFLELDITSLLDILIILLVFLLKSYNSSGIVINVPQGINLPRSESPNQSSSGILVQVSPSKIWVEDKIVLDSEKSTGKIYSHGGRLITPLFDELMKRKEIIQQVERSSKNAKKFSGLVNFVIDKSLTYTELRKLMYTSAEAGFIKFKFAVLKH